MNAGIDRKAAPKFCIKTRLTQEKSGGKYFQLLSMGASRGRKGYLYFIFPWFGVYSLHFLVMFSNYVREYIFPIPYSRIHLSYKEGLYFFFLASLYAFGWQMWQK